MDSSEQTASSRLSAKFARSLQSCADFLHSCAMPCLGESESALSELIQATQRPFTVAFFGRMKTGKSSLINALIGTQLAITGTEEATATINLLTYSDDPQRLNKFTVHWIGRPAEDFPLEELQRDWTGKSEAVMERVRQTQYIQLYSSYPSLKQHEVIDTPGTGSNAAEHEQSAQEVLSGFTDISSPQCGMRADALVYVFPPIGRESDEDSLRAFRLGCMPDSTPYNSVGVLHKWDHIYWQNGGDFSEIQSKANALKKTLHGMLADVIPVSAPLAMAAHHLPDYFYQELFAIIDEKGEMLMRLLSRDEKWDRDERCRRLRQIGEDILPWQSFQIIVRECLQCSTRAIPEVRKRIMALSGLAKLRDFIDREFFTRGAIIRQKQNFSRINRIHSSALAALDNERQKAERDDGYWRELRQQMSDNSQLKDWVNAKCRANCDRIYALKKAGDKLDAMFTNGEISATIADMDAQQWCSAVGTKLFTAEEHLVLHQLFNVLCESNDCENTLSIASLMTLGRKCSAFGNFYPEQEARRHTTHICHRIMQVVKRLEQNGEGRADL
jgi:hypothetical protein